MATISTTFALVDEISPALKAMNSALGSVIGCLEKMDGTISGIDSKSLEALNDAAKDVDKALGSLGQEADATAKSIKKVNTASESLKNVSKTLGGVGKGLETVGKAGSVVTGALTAMTAAAANTSVKFIKLYESSQTVFKQMLGGEKAAKDMYSSLLDVAKASTFSQETFLTAGKSLVGVGVSADNTTKYLQAISDAVTGFGGDSQNIEQLSNAFKKTVTNGKISMEEINMMSDGGIQALKILANQYGVTTSEMQEMISYGALPSEEVLEKLTEGIEKGTNGINGYTAAMEGMSKAMKGKTLTGALDSMNSAIRTFSLNLIGMDPRTESGSARINQLTASVSTLNQIIEKSSPVFKGITDSIGNLLDKLVGANVTFDEATGTWQNVGGILGSVQHYLENTDPEVLSRLGNSMVKVGVSAPVMLGAGKVITALSTSLDKLSEKKDILSRVFNGFSKGSKIEEPKETKASQTTKKTNISTSLPNIGATFQNFISRIQSFGKEAEEVTEERGTGVIQALNRSFGSGLSTFRSSMDSEWAKTSKVSAINNMFLSMESAVNTNGLSFKEKMQNALSSAVPDGNTFTQKLANSLKGFGTSVATASAGVGRALKTVVPDTFAEGVALKFNRAKTLSLASLGSLKSGALTHLTSLTTAVTGVLGNLGAKIAGSGFIGKLVGAFAPLSGILGSVIAGVTSIGASFLTAAGFMSVAAVGVGAVIGALGLLNKNGDTSQMIDGFFTSFNQKVSQFGTMAVNAITSFSENFRANFPTLVQRGSELLLSIINGIGQTIPVLITVAGQVTGSLLTALIEGLPTLVEGGFSAVQSLASGISNSMFLLTESGFSMIRNLGNSISQNFPTFVQSGKETLLALVTGLKNTLPVLVESGLNMLISFGNAVVQNLPYVIETGVSIIQSLVSGISEMIPVIISTGFQLITSLISSIWEHKGEILTLGWNLITTLAQGIISLTGSVLQAAWDIGSAIVQGIWQGITGLWSDFTGWLGGIFSGVIDTVKGIFGVNSPSTVFQSIGGFLIEGLKNGVENMWNGVSGVLSGIGNAIKDLLTPDVDYAQMIANTQAQIESLKQNVQSGYEQIRTMTISSNQSMASATITIFAQMGTQVLNEIALLVSGIQKNLSNGILPAFSTVFNQIRQNTLALLMSMQGAAITSIQNLVSTVGSTLTPLAVQFSSVFTLIANTAVGAFEALRGQVLSILSSIQISSMRTIQLMSESVSGYFIKLSASVSRITEVMASNIVGTISTMNASIVSATESMRSAYLSTWESLTVSSLTTLNLLTQSAITKITGMANTLISIWSQMGTTILTDLSQLTKQIISAMELMTRSVISTISILPGEFRRIATQMMNDFRAGIDSNKAGVLNTTASLVQQLKNVFESGLSIHSPSVYMYWIGQMMLAGLIAGMSGNQVQKFIENMITGMQSTFEKGSFDANQVVNFLSDQGTLDLIGRLSGMDMSNVSPEQIAYPLIGTLGTQTSWFGPRESPGGIGSTNHGGVDLAAPTGTPIAAALGGNVTTAGWYGGYGNAVVVDSGNGIDITYGHMSQVLATVGQNVTKGQQIGLVGSTGNSTGPHLHFEIHQNGQRIDPQPFIEGAGITAGNTLVSAIQNAYNIKHGLAPIASTMANVTYNPSAGVSQWSNVVLQALAMLGQPASLLPGVLYAIESESGGNPNAINDWDSNAAMGDPSRGLLQTIGSTFNAYRNPSLSSNIYDPLANVYAALNYMIQRYGSVANVVNPRLGGWYGYASGTAHARKGLAVVGENGPELIDFSGGEVVKNATDTSRMLNYSSLEQDIGTNRVVVNLTAPRGNQPVTIEVHNYINSDTDVNKVSDSVYEAVYRALEDEYQSTGGLVSAY